MGILDSFKNLARPYDENDMFLDDEEILEEEFPEPEAVPAQAAAPAPGAQSFSAPAQSQQSAFSQRDNRVVSINTTASLQVVIVKPEQFDAAASIAATHISP